MNSRVDLLTRHWRLYERGILTDHELVLSFLDDLDILHLASDWEILPSSYRKVILQLLDRCPPPELPDVFIVGPAPPEAIAAWSELRRDNARRLLEYLNINA